MTAAVARRDSERGNGAPGCPDDAGLCQSGKCCDRLMNMKRMRGRNHRPGGGGGGGGGTGGGSPIRHHNGQIPLNRNHVFDSNGPDLRIRGTAQQLFEKYLQLGRDATSSGDRVMAEGYFQHAEHYFRILNAMAQAAQQPQGSQQGIQQVSHPNNQQRGRPGDEQDGEDRGADDPLISGSTPQPQIVERANNERPPQNQDAQERRDRQAPEHQGSERSANQGAERVAGERPAGEPRPRAERTPRQPRERPAPALLPEPAAPEDQPETELTTANG